jgi:hypothetical protein
MRKISEEFPIEKVNQVGGARVSSRLVEIIGHGLLVRRQGRQGGEQSLHELDKNIIGLVDHVRRYHRAEVIEHGGKFIGNAARSRSKNKKRIAGVRVKVIEPCQLQRAAEIRCADVEQTVLRCASPAISIRKLPVAL